MAESSPIEKCHEVNETQYGQQLPVDLPDERALFDLRPAWVGRVFRIDTVTVIERFVIFFLSGYIDSLKACYSRSAKSDRARLKA